MKNFYKKVMIIVTVALIAGYNVYKSPSIDGMSELMLMYVEALASDESSSGYGCGYAAYEWDNDWYEDTKNFTRCVSGCPPQSGTNPQYMDCR